MPDLHLVILAAGRGVRMKSAAPKVLHDLGGVPLIEHVLRAAAPLEAASTTVVIGHEGDRVRAALAGYAGLQFAVQEPQRGTGHAVLQTAPLLKGVPGNVLLLSGDVPLLSSHTLRVLVHAHETSGAALTMLTAMLADPHGYGRILRVRDRVTAIIEERDASPEERGIHEINTGIYIFDGRPLFGTLERLQPDNKQQEYYLTDLVALYRQQNLDVETVEAADPAETRGVNTRADLAALARLARQRKNAELMAAGVTIEDPETAYIGVDVSIGPDTVLKPSVFIEGQTTIGSGCQIQAGVRIVDSTLADRVIVRNYSVVTGARIASGAVIGPFAHLRPDTDVSEDARVGNFVELKKTRLGRHSKANHLAYLGDATIGDNVNIGAGTITCNYDGKQKHQTIIENDVFIGSDSQLVAPVQVGEGAYVAAGSTVTEDVPAKSLAIGRGRQVNKLNWKPDKGRGRGTSEEMQPGEGASTDLKKT